MLEEKLQLKPGQTIAIVDGKVSIPLNAPRATPNEAAAVLLFVAGKAALLNRMADLKEWANAGKLTWVAYPKVGLLGTDINRDSLRELVNAYGLDPVRQVAIDATWSALRLKPLA